MSVFAYKKNEIEKGLGIYSELDAQDIIDRLAPTLARGGYKITYEDKIEATGMAVSWNTPWLHQKQSINLRCNLWHYIMFGHYRWFVPSECQNCFKVVVSPRTLEELWQLVEVQKKLNIASKCGIEVREYTPKLYGGYFYNKGIDNGLSCYKIVREAINDEIGPDVPVILKRACTEYEMEHPDSSSWSITPEQSYVEEIINGHVDEPNSMGPQPSIVRKHIRRMWIHWAYAAGDKTYLKFTNDRPLYSGYVTYHDKTREECEKMFIAGRAKSANMKKERLYELTKTLTNVAQERNATMDEIAISLNLTNPMFIGEHDETTY